MRSQKVAVTLAEHAGAVRGLAFSENGYYMASGAKDEVVISGSDDKTVRLWVDRECGREG